MRQLRNAAIVLAASFCIGSANAQTLDATELVRRGEAFVQSLIGGPPVDQEIIRPPGDIDPKMALAPPAGGTLRQLAPPDRFRQQ